MIGVLDGKISLVIDSILHVLVLEVLHFWQVGLLAPLGIVAIQVLLHPDHPSQMVHVR